MSHVELLMEKANFPEESRAFLTDLCRRLAADSRYETLSRRLIDHDYSDSSELIAVLDSMSPEFGVYKYSIYLAFYLNASELLLDKYRANNIDEELFWFMTVDYRCKLEECRANDGIWGTSAAAWHAPFYHLTRFAHGRLQYDYSAFDGEIYERGGHVIRKGEPALRIHIPSSGPLTRELRHDSYRRAYEFNRERLNWNGVVPISCSSWLLYPAHKEMLPPTSNIVGFIDDFDMISSSTSETFGNAWRVFGPASKLPLEQWPEDTGLRRAYKKWLLSGKPAGSGYGIFFHDEQGRVR